MVVSGKSWRAGVAGRRSGRSAGFDELVHEGAAEEERRKRKGMCTLQVMSRDGSHPEPRTSLRCATFLSYIFFHVSAQVARSFRRARVLVNSISSRSYSPILVSCTANFVSYKSVCLKIREARLDCYCSFIHPLCYVFDMDPISFLHVRSFPASICAT